MSNRCSIPMMLVVIVTVSILSTMVVEYADSGNAEYRPISGTADENIQDLGSFNSMAITVQYSPVIDDNPATSVRWDFGDDTGIVEKLPSDLVRHEYTKTGVYVITQTALNDAGSSIAKYQVNILGYPIVTYKWCYDRTDTNVVQSAYNINAEYPEIPDRPGYYFCGWYLDNQYKNEFSNGGVKESCTLFAKWTEEGAVEKFYVTFYGPDNVTKTVLIDKDTDLLKVDLTDLLSIENKEIKGIYSDEFLSNKWDNKGLNCNSVVYVDLSESTKSDENNTVGFDQYIPFVIGVIILIIVAGIIVKRQVR